MIHVTPPPVSRLQFEKEKEERAKRGEPPPPCQICEILLSWLLDPLWERRRRFDEHVRAAKFVRSDSHGNRPLGPSGQIMDLGTFENAIASPCSQHTAVLNYLKDCPRHDFRSSDRLWLTFGPSGVHLRGWYRRSRVYKPDKTGEVELVLADFPGKKQFQGDMRILDQGWVDLHVISQWIDDCSKRHGEECENPMKIMRVVPDLLVDVRRKCIVNGEEGLRYMALSYRLGKAKPFRLCLSDVDAFREIGILEDVKVLEQLPLTVRHAVLLAGQLEYDYLWTDVLCIVHDGPDTLSDQLNKMSAIYASAVTTIVATDGDGADGILGLHGISGPRDLQQPAYAIRDKYLFVEEMGGTQVTNSNNDYNSRGWTYQEYVMSPRKLVLMHKQAYWLCRRCQRRESDARVWECKDRGSSGPTQFIRSGYPDLTQASELLSWYNKRNLTYPEDALSAISGLLAVLSRGFEGGFLYGLPEKFFDICLTWRPIHYDPVSDYSETKACRQRRGPSVDCKPWGTTAAASEMPS
jgi:hypothetical protein